jgi:hypothetical protein
LLANLLGPWIEVEALLWRWFTFQSCAESGWNTFANTVRRDNNPGSLREGIFSM